VFEDRGLRKIHGPRREEMTGEWRRMRDEELYALYSSANIIRVKKSRRVGWLGHVSCMEYRIGAHSVLMGRPERKRPLGRPRYR